LDAHLQAAFESRDLQDFAMNGAAGSVQLAKILTAFWNAAIQGRYRFFRSMYNPRDPDQWKKTLMKGFGWITSAKMLEQYINWDNEDYWKQPRWQRMLAFHFPITKDDTGHWRFILVPVPFEAGLIFATLPGAMMEYVKERNVASAMAFSRHFIDQSWDNPVPQVIQTAWDLKPELGFDSFREIPILSRGAEKQPYWMRWTDSSSLMSKKIGKMLNVAPGKIEYAIRRTTGGLGTLGMHYGVDKILGVATGEPGASLPPYWGRTLLTPEAGSRSQIIDDFYKKLNLLIREQSAREAGKTDRTINLSELKAMLKAEADMADIRRSYKGKHDMAWRIRQMRKIENIAERFVRTPTGEYKSPKVKK
jgi:hypothetical protein